MIDENVPRQLALHLSKLGLDVAVFPGSWKGMTNGRLLDRLEAEGYDVLLTSDRNMLHQQHLVGRRLGVVVLPSTRRAEIVALVDRIKETISQCGPGQGLAI